MAGQLSHRGEALRRRTGLLVLVLAVAALHGLVMQVVAERLGAFDAADAMPARIEVAYVRELTPSAPPAIAPLPVAAPAFVPRQVVQQPAAAASAAASAAQHAKALAEAHRLAAAQAEAHRRVAAQAVATRQAAAQAAADESLRSAAAAVASAAAEAATRAGADVPDVPDVSDAPDVPAGAGDVSGAVGADSKVGANSAAPAATFVWPASTRVSYNVTGNYRGPVQGDAQVEWVHAGTRYQVHLDVTIGAHFAPLITRRMSSDGELTANGLAPTRYDQETRLIFHDRHRASLRFEPEAVVLADGRRHASMPGVQDSASQFIQLSYLFATQPGLLQVGRSVELPLALPRKLDRWVYDVAGEELLYTSFGALETFHVKPRRLPQPGGDLVAEAWFAPTLRYLPVRIRISQDAETYIDLLIARKPELAAP